MMKVFNYFSYIQFRYQKFLVYKSKKEEDNFDYFVAALFAFSSPWQARPSLASFPGWEGHLSSKLPSIVSVAWSGRG